jgi:hypothetical protein
LKLSNLYYFIGNRHDNHHIPVLTISAIVLAVLLLKPVQTLAKGLSGAIFATGTSMRMWVVRPKKGSVLDVPKCPSYGRGVGEGIFG